MGPVPAKFLFGMLQMVNRSVNGSFNFGLFLSHFLPFCSPLGTASRSAKRAAGGAVPVSIRPCRGKPGAVDGSGYVEHNLPTARRTRQVWKLSWRGQLVDIGSTAATAPSG